MVTYSEGRHVSCRGGVKNEAEVAFAEVKAEGSGRVRVEGEKGCIGGKGKELCLAGR